MFRNLVIPVNIPTLKSYFKQAGIIIIVNSGNDRRTDVFHNKNLSETNNKYNKKVRGRAVGSSAVS